MSRQHTVRAYDAYVLVMVAVVGADGAVVAIHDGGLVARTTHIVQQDAATTGAEAGRCYGDSSPPAT